MKKLLNIRKVGSSLRLTISEIAWELGLGEGDKVQVVRTLKGFELIAYDADFGNAVETARGFMQKYPKTMKTLSK